MIFSLKFFLTFSYLLWGAFDFVHWVGDFRLLAPTMYIFFASALPVIAFGEQISNETGWCLFLSSYYKSDNLLQKITFSIQLGDPGQLQKGYEMNLV